jgi:hypothetical protein
LPLIVRALLKLLRLLGTNRKFVLTAQPCRFVPALSDWRDKLFHYRIQLLQVKRFFQIIVKSERAIIFRDAGIGTEGNQRQPGEMRFDPVAKLA